MSPPADRALSDPEASEVAAALLEAERAGRQISLVSLRYPEMTMADAYAIQARFVAAREAAGARRIGWKIGLTSRAMQAALGIDTPDSGVLFDDMLFPHGGTVPPGRFIAPRVEAEIAFLLRAGIGPGATREQVLDATEAVCPALEILDTRILRADPQTGRGRNVFDTIADNAANAGLVLGVERHDPRAFDLARVGAVLWRDGIVEETGLGAGVLGDPVRALTWLAERLAEHGGALRAGDIVLSGSFIRPVEARPGAHFLGDFGAFGRVEITFG